MIQRLTRTIQHIGDTINSITQGTVIGKAAVVVGSAITAFFTPIKWLLLICFITTIVDMIFGLRVARKQNKKIESSKNWKGTLRKILDEFIIISLAHGIEWSVLDQSGVFLLTGGSTAIITLTEMWSILENLNTIDPKGPWKNLSKFLKKKGEDYIGLEFGTEDEHTDYNEPSKESL